MAKNYQKPVHEYYPTPIDAIRPLLDLIQFESIKPNMRFAEPCRGIAKAIYNFLPDGSEYCELSEGKDYLKSKWGVNPDCIITNPPFSLAKEFLEKSLEEADVCIYLLRLGFLETMKRKEFHQAHPVNHLVVLSKRPSFTGDGKTDGTGYAWYIYDPKNRLGLTQPVYVV